ncbi:SusC/RagA family TonB-linked outer membrane protein [Fulvivirgaceae bacterium BMA12]|uniref:SusC/RagA family TonB-linked outer membrane protein n=1 Tax=Agaribacillus aureus TaxID=3051825 RepID=A0ABT8L1R3_9BACT|nr:SusC/RagA family TonB-linked outer membrane protein [Fulvivirgaceae bacterium BMA12]
MNSNLRKLLMFASRQALYILILQTLVMQFIMASPSHSQSIEKAKISIDLKNATLTELFLAIEDQTNFVFVYSNDIRKIKTKISLSHSETTVADVLRFVAAKQKLKFKQINDNITVSRNLSADGKNPVDSAKIANNVAITGKVTDENGEPLPGATVQVKGTSIGTVTDAKGNFKLDIPERSLLIVAFVGYTSQEFMITNQTVFNVQLKPDITSLDEVVVTALGVERKERELGYAVQEIEGKEITTAKETNFLNSLSGRVAGVQVINGNTGVGSSSRVIIRGETSLSGDNQPLFVVDGVPINNRTAASITDPDLRGPQEVDYGNGAGEINPDDIQSISVLKGASAAALYGSRAANGVILITTKFAQKEGVLVEVNSSVQFSDFLVLPKWQNEYGQGTRGEFAYENGLGSGLADIEDVSWGPAFDGAGNITQFDGLSIGPNGEPLRGGDVLSRGSAVIGTGGKLVTAPPGNSPAITPTPWQAQPNNLEDFLERGVTFSNNFAVSGGNDQGGFRLSHTNLSSDGIIPNTNLERNITALKGSYRISKRLKASAGINYLRSQSDNRPSAGYGSENPMYVYMWFGRQVSTDALREYWQRGHIGTAQFNYNYAYHDNPFFTVYENTNGFLKNRILGNISLDFQLTDELSLMLRTGIDFFNDNRQSKRAYSTQRFPLGMYRRDDAYFEERNTDFLLNYKKQVNASWTISVSLGGNRMDQETRFTSNIAGQLAVPGVYNLSNSKIQVESSQIDTDKRINSLYGFGQVSFRDMINLDITGRNDWSSTLPKGNNSYFYPSVTLSTILSSLVNLPDQVSFAKLRLGYAEVGEDTDPFRLKSSYLFGNRYDNQFAVTEQSDLPNNNLKPGRQKSFEIGTDLRFFNNRFGLDISYYDTKSEDQIILLPVSSTTGYETRIINAGKIKNYGMEVMLRATLVKTDQFEWNTYANFTRNDSRVLEVLDGSDTYTYVSSAVYDFTATTIFANAVVGGKIGDIYGTGFKKSPDGRIIFQDGLPVPDPELRLLGNYNPDFMLGFGNTFSYKNLSFDFLFDWRQGGKVVSRTFAVATLAGNLDIATNGREGGVIGDGVKNVGTEENPQYVDNDVSVSSEDFHKTFYNRNHEESALFDASFVKLREVKLSYRFPESMFSPNFPIKEATLSLIGRNLMLWTNQDYFDPETITLENDRFVPGVEEASYPSIRSYGVSLNVKF